MMDSIDKIKIDAEARMAKTVETLKSDLGKIRAGRAHPGILETVRVDYYGQVSPLSQVANIAASDARTLTVTPWDKSMVGAIEKAIRDSNLGLNPAPAGAVIRVPLPALTEERRKELGKHVRTEGETARVAIRNVRRDANQHLKELLKQKTITEDDDKRAEGDIQKTTDKSIIEVDKLVAAKEHDLLQV
jgi:ribosome recycling factor